MLGPENSEVRETTTGMEKLSIIEVVEISREVYLCFYIILAKYKLECEYSYKLIKISVSNYLGLEGNIRDNYGLRNETEIRPSDLDPSKNVANHTKYVRKISLVKTMLAE